VENIAPAPFYANMTAVWKKARTEAIQKRPSACGKVELNRCPPLHFPRNSLSRCIYNFHQPGKLIDIKMFCEALYRSVETTFYRRWLKQFRFPTNKTPQPLLYNTKKTDRRCLAIFGAYVSISISGGTAACRSFILESPYRFSQGFGSLAIIYTRQHHCSLFSCW